MKNPPHSCQFTVDRRDLHSSGLAECDEFAQRLRVDTIQWKARQLRKRLQIAHGRFVEGDCPGLLRFGRSDKWQELVFGKFRQRGYGLSFAYAHLTLCK